MTNITDIIKTKLEGDGEFGAEQLAQALIQKAKDGNATIAKLIFERIDGPAKGETRKPLNEEERLEQVIAILERARDRQSGSSSE